MGMYDNINVHVNHLPEKYKQYTSGWQTKSHDSILNRLEIDEDGQLISFNVPMFTVDEPDKIPEETDHTGEIRFYQSINDVFVEFVAFFENGVMFKMVQTSPEK